MPGNQSGYPNFSRLSLGLKGEGIILRLCKDVNFSRFKVWSWSTFSEIWMCEIVVEVALITHSNGLIVRTRGEEGHLTTYLYKLL